MQPQDPEKCSVIDPAALRSALDAALAEILEEMSQGPFNRWIDGKDVFEKHGDPTPYDINNGDCENFCRAVCDRLGGETDSLVGVDIYAMKDYYQFFTCEFDISHVALYADGRFYDAECLDGVNHWIDLPLCQKAWNGKKVGPRQARRRAEADS